MRKIFISLLSMLTLGISGVWAEDATTLYERALSGDNAWASTDITTKSDTVGAWYSKTFTTDATNGLYQAAATGSRSAVLTYSPTEKSILTIDVAFSNLGNTGNAGNYSYLKIGSGIEIQSNQQNQNGAVIINGTSNAISNCNQKNYNRGGDVWTIHAVINTATNMLTEFTLVGTTMSGKSASYTLASGTSLGSATYNTITVGTVRAGGSPAVAINSIKISEEKQSVSTAEYSINYNFTENGTTSTLMTETSSTTVGASVNATSPITIDGQKYYIKDGQTSSMTIGTGTNTLDVELRMAETYVYSLQSSLGTTIAEGTFTEGESETVNWSKYMKNESDGKWYVAEGTTFSKTYTESVADDRVSYQESDIDYFFEAESIVSRTYGTVAGDAYSNGVSAGVLGGATLTMSGISSGIYTLTANTSVRRSGDDKFTVQTSADGSEWADAGTLDLTTNVPGDFSLEGISITADASYIRLVEANAANQYHYVDYVTLTKTGEIPTTVTKQYANNGTICFEYGADILETSTAKVYMFDGIYAGNVYGSEVTSLEPGMPYIVLAGNLDLSYVKENAAVEGQNCNGLIGVLDSKGTTVSGKAYMIFVGGDIYYASDEGNTVSAGHAYFDVAQIPAGKPQTQEAKALFGFNFDTPTGINAVNALKNDAPVYNIAGQLVSKAQNGIFIVNGKKVVVK